MASHSLSRSRNLHRCGIVVQNAQIKKTMKTLFSKLKEPSTIRGIAIIGAVAGLSLEPAKWDAIGSALAAIIGLIEIFRKEK
jgi:hypothetical protein